MLRSMGSACAVLALAGSWALSQEERPVHPLWPGRPPGETAELPPEADVTRPTDNRVAGRPVIRLGNISRPTLTLWSAPKEKATGAAVVIAPGGGYNILAWDLEGTEVAGWLNGLGVAGLVLKYRVPRRPDQPRDEPPIGALQDAQRAISLVRSRAREWEIDPQRIGMLGFSAGGHLTAWTASQFERRSYPPVDEVDAVSCRPDFCILIYPAYLLTREGDRLAPAIQATAASPPAFFVHAADDGVRAVNSLVFATALQNAGVKSEVHLYSQGGHGFGLRRTDRACTTWPDRCAEWLRGQGYLKKAE